MNVTTFRTNRNFQLSDVREYKDFVLKLPDIGSHVTFMEDNNGHSRFWYQLQVKNNPEKVTHVIIYDNGHDETYDDTTSITTSKSTNVQDLIDGDNWNTCNGTSNDLSKMLNAFWPTIECYINHNPMHDRALQWKH